MGRYGRAGGESSWADHRDCTTGPIKDWQVSNEPNSSVDLAGTGPATVGRFLTRTARVIHPDLADPDSRIISAGVDSVSRSNSSAERGARYLRRMLQQQAAAGRPAS